MLVKPISEPTTLPVAAPRMRIYVAGPYSGGDVAQNVRTAVFEADFITSHLGHLAYCPHLTHFWHMLLPHEYEFWMQYDLAWLEICDALLRLPGESAGADREVAHALERGKTVYYSVFDIPPAGG